MVEIFYNLNMPLLLTTAAQYPYLISVTMIVLSFFLLLWLLVRMEFGQNWNASNVTYVQQMPVMPQPMMAISNPFVVSIDDSKSSSLRDGISFDISCQVDCFVDALWNVNIADVHKLINLNRNYGFTPDVQGSYLHKEKQTRLPCCSGHRYFLKAPECSMAQSTESFPRTVYPLILILSRASDDDEPNGNDIISMICSVHVKDTICTMESRILTEYLKHRDGRVSTLRKLYVESDSTHETREQSDSYKPEHPDCIICQTKPISHALLPCRHTCVCGSCFKQLEGRCPMCRSPITSYFSILSDENVIVPEPPSEAEPPPFLNPFNRFINGIIQWT